MSIARDGRVLKARARLSAVCVAAGLLAACTTSAPSTTAPVREAGSPLHSALAALTSSNPSIVDLTHPLSPDGLYWPTGTPFEHRRLAWGPSDGGYWYAAGEFTSPEHLGTHLDAPVHFAEGGWSAAEVPVDRLVAPAITIDLRAKAAAEPDAVLSAEDLTTWEMSHGPIPAGSIVVVHTGWSTRWPDWVRYYGSETPKDVTTLHFPGVSKDAAAALAARRVFGVGIDTASIDPGVSQQFDAHRVLAAAGIFNLENLTGVDRLPPVGSVIAALPMKIADGTGGPARVVAIVANPNPTPIP